MGGNIAGIQSTGKLGAQVSRDAMSHLKCNRKASLKKKAKAAKRIFWDKVLTA